MKNGSRATIYLRESFNSLYTGFNSAVPLSLRMEATKGLAGVNFLLLGSWTYNVFLSPRTVAAEEFANVGIEAGDDK